MQFNNNNKKILMGENFIQNCKFWLFKNVGRNQTTVGNNNEYNIITLTTQVLLVEKKSNIIK